MQMHRILKLVFLSATLFITACSGDGKGSAAVDREVPARLASSDLPQTSLYQLDSDWITDTGAATKLASFQGRPAVVAVIFTNCAFACPMTVRDMKRLGGALPESIQDEVRYLLISLDPDRDTPEAMSRFKKAHGLNDQWTLLAGSASDVRVLANLIGVRYKKQTDGQFAHTNQITLLDVSGTVVHRQKGLGAEDAVTRQKLADLLATNNTPN